MTRKTWAVAAAVVVSCWTGGVAADDVQLWTRLDSRVQLDTPRDGDGAEEAWWALRLQTNLRLSLDDPGLSLLALRGGPEWRPLSWFRLAINGFVGANRSGGSLQSDYRVELEPTLSFRLQSLRVSNRIRIEERWSDGRRPMRYRDQLAVTLRLSETIEPVVYGEGFITQGEGFSQFRASAGVRIRFDDAGSLEAGYLHVQTSANDWTPTHILNLNWGP